MSNFCCCCCGLFLCLIPVYFVFKTGSYFFHMLWGQFWGLFGFTLDAIETSFLKETLIGLGPYMWTCLMWILAGLKYLAFILANIYICFLAL